MRNKTILKMKKIIFIAVALIAFLPSKEQAFTGRTANAALFIRKTDTAGVIPVIGNNTVAFLFRTADTSLYWWTNVRKTWTLYAPGGGGSAPPFADNVAIAKNNSDNSKLFKFDLSTITTGTTRTGTIPNFSSFTFAAKDQGQSWTGAQDMTGATLAVPTGTAGTGGSAAASEGYADASSAAALALAERTVFSQTADQTVANTTTQTSLIGTGVGSLVIPANSLTVGRTLHIKGYGVLATAASAPTINFSIEGSTASSSTVSPTLTGSMSNAMVEWDIYIVIRTTGTSGTAALGGYVSINGVKDYYNNAAWGINTTLSDTFDYQVLWGTASASNTVVSFVNKFTLE
jgi:hypothetical protein